MAATIAEGRRHQAACHGFARIDLRFACHPAAGRREPGLQ
jgi:hypothetical protein